MTHASDGIKFKEKNIHQKKSSKKKMKNLLGHQYKNLQGIGHQNQF